MISESELASFVVALFSMMNPIGNLGIFAGMTSNRPKGEVARIAWSSAAAISVILLIVVWAGSMAMQLFGITVDTLRASGGIIILLIGLRMLFNNSDHKHSDDELEEAGSSDSIAVVPIAIPIVAGPGTIATVLVAVEHSEGVFGKMEFSIVIVLMAALCGLLFSFATPISRRLGASGMGVVTRVMGMVLAAIAVGMITESLKSLLPGLAG